MSGGVSMITATTSEVQNNFGKFLKLVQSGDEVIILKNGKEVARLISHNHAVSFLTDSLTGILHNDYNEKEEREERLKKYESVD